MKPIRVVLAEDHDLVRAGISALLNNYAKIEVVGEADNGHEALRLIEQQQPDVVLMDVRMAGLNGLEATQRVTKEYPDVRVIILSMHAQEEYVLQAMRAGASGYVLKDSSPTELAKAIEAVAGGEIYLSPAVAGHVIADYARQAAGQSRASTPLEQLTPRQREILRLIGEGCSTQEIAETLVISAKTVETHRAQLMERLGVRDVAGLVRHAIQRGLVTLDE